MKIKIIRAGPYHISGNVPLLEKVIVHKGRGYIFAEGRKLPQAGEYDLCRCGKSKNMPFCDGEHEKAHFVGSETASREPYEDRAEKLAGPAVDLLDDNRCAYARFCHRKAGSVWELTRESDLGDNKMEAIKAASDCPTGRLVAMEKDGRLIEPEYEPSVNIIQDPEEKVSGGLFVKGGIPIESADGHIYEIRNRVTLCRCGKSKNTPFCDATHVQIDFCDNK